MIELPLMYGRIQLEDKNAEDVILVDILDGISYLLNIQLHRHQLYRHTEDTPAKIEKITLNNLVSLPYPNTVNSNRIISASMDAISEGIYESIKNANYQYLIACLPPANAIGEATITVVKNISSMLIQEIRTITTLYVVKKQKEQISQKRRVFIR